MCLVLCVTFCPCVALCMRVVCVLGSLVAAIPRVWIVTRSTRVVRAVCSCSAGEVRFRSCAVIMANLSFPAWMAKAESEAPRGDEFYTNLAEALKQNDVTHWTRPLEVDPSSL